MAKRKSKQASGKEAGSLDSSSVPLQRSNAAGTVTANANDATSTTSNASSASTAKKPSSPALLIYRNKHWRHISCYHGTWLHIPFEIFEGISHINYNALEPRPIDPGSLFDTLKVRRLVDEATNLAVRAASDNASPMLTNLNGRLANSPARSSLALGGSGHGAKLSKERKFRMREQACQKLGRAYRLDEISCSVATMQGASALGEVGQLVMQRNPGDTDARYVNFFHEKIPSRQIAECTSLEPLTDIISERPEEPEVLRTRAFVKVFKQDFQGAILDLTHAMSASRYRCSHDPKPPVQDDNTHVQESQRPGTRRRPNDVILSENEQPTSFEGQLLFQRASVYLSLACEHARDGLPAPSPPSEANESDAKGVSKNDAENNQVPLEKQAESRRLAKHYAKRAIKDFMAFLSQFQYSPNYPVRAVREYSDRVSNLRDNGRIPREPGGHQGGVEPPLTVYSVPELFAAVPPADLPPNPTPEPQEPQQQGSSTSSTTCEWVTFHPLLTDALHSLLLCHLLIQTSVKELQRHAYMVARLLRLADGFPIFRPSRCPSRADWLEIIGRAGNWLNLTDTWENLTTPTLIPLRDPEPEQQKRISGSSSSSSSSSSASSSSASPTLSPSSSTSTIKTHPSLSNLTLQTAPSDATTTAHKSKPPSPTTYEEKLSKWLVDDTREYPILTDRAACLARWLQDAPPVSAGGTTSGAARRKKRSKKSTAKVEDDDDDDKTSR